jgi:aminoglycoside phosphotransferase (APT) family kinase protein
MGDASPDVLPSRAALDRYLRDAVPELGEVGAITLLAGGRSNLTFRVDTATGPCVLRRPPMGTVAPSANDMAREFRFLCALHPMGVRVPRPFHLCEDSGVIGAPFVLAEFVDGRAISGPAAALGLGATARESAWELVDQLAVLHEVPVDHPTITSLGRPDGYIERQVARWRSQWEIVATRDVPAFDALHRGLADAVPARSDRAVVHGDYRIDNVLFHRDAPTIVAMIDWEMAALGDPLADLGLLLTYWDPVCAPLLADGHPIAANRMFPTASELADRYLCRTGRAGKDLPFYVALGCYKLAVVAEGIHRRFVEGRTVGPGFDRVHLAVEPLVAAGLDHLAA